MQVPMSTTTTSMEMAMARAQTDPNQWLDATSWAREVKSRAVEMRTVPEANRRRRQRRPRPKRTSRAHPSDLNKRRRRLSQSTIVQTAATRQGRANQMGATLPNPHQSRSQQFPWQREAWRNPPTSPNRRAREGQALALEANTRPRRRFLRTRAMTRRLRASRTMGAPRPDRTLNRGKQSPAPKRQKHGG